MFAVHDDQYNSTGDCLAEQFVFIMHHHESVTIFSRGSITICTVVNNVLLMPVYIHQPSVLRRTLDCQQHNTQ